MGQSTSANGDRSKLPQNTAIGISPNYTSGAPYDPQDLYSAAGYDAPREDLDFRHLQFRPEIYL